ncbi:MAG: methyltransferase domain-containing protein [Sedimentisphaerales bacterium]|nr:methyltransferase domain-containing protein [Sedimentisphaerales bacterium]
MEQTRTLNPLFDTAERIKEKYNRPNAAQRYAGYFQDARRHRSKHRREARCIAKALGRVSPPATVLDLPCGTGRMYPLLKQLGYTVVSADSSPYMVQYAQRRAETLNLDHSQDRDRFQVADVFQTGFADKQFDAVVCNRLFHHFAEPQARQQALRELGRICSGPIVVSFFSMVATDALKYYFKKYVRRQFIRDRIPISPRQWARDVRSSGLRIEWWILSRPLLSMQWYVILRAV